MCLIQIRNNSFHLYFFYLATFSMFLSSLTIGGLCVQFSTVLKRETTITHVVPIKQPPYLPLKLGHKIRQLSQSLWSSRYIPPLCVLAGARVCLCVSDIAEMLRLSTVQGCQVWPFRGQKMTNLAFFYIGWPGHFLEFIKYLAFLKVYRRFYSKIKTFFLFKTDFGIFR